jgi:hypothetical protein
VLRVKCVDETNGKWVEKIGNDEIYLGGFAIKHNGDTSPIAPTSIYPSFDDGDVKVFNPPKVFYTFSSLTTFPKEFGVGLILIEKDNGGSTEAMNKISEQVQVLIKASLPVAGGVLGAAIGLVISPLLNWISNTIIAGIRDDLFPPQIAKVKIPTQNFTWSGSNHSAEKTLRIVGHQGVYELTYDWMFH